MRLDPKHENLGYITHGHLVIRQETLGRVSSWLVSGLHLPPAEGESPT